MFVSPTSNGNSSNTISGFAWARSVPFHTHKVKRSIFSTTKCYALKTTRSEQIFEEAQTMMPGGVNSPVRAFRSVGGNPIVFDRVKGAYMYDVDGNKYIDYVLSWGPAIVGHAHDDVTSALHAQLEKGTSFGAPCLLENELARLVINRVPSIDRVRFVNSGTEACLSVLRLMRAYTGRDRVIKFTGCYHGHADSFLVQAGSGVATLGLPDSPGVLKSATAATLCAKYNDIDSVKTLLRENQGSVAGVIIEPVVGNAGFIKPKEGFLEELRKITKDEGVLLCLDEVMTGFRVSHGGAQTLYNIHPDLTTLGKIVGGGLPVGAYGGKKEIMDLVSPAGPMYQAGTLSGNPLAMTAGIETLKIMDDVSHYVKLNELSQHLTEGLVEAAKKAGVKLVADYVGGMFGLFFSETSIGSYEEAVQKTNKALFPKFHRGMLEEGIYLAPSQYEAGFLSIQHTHEDIEKTLIAATRVFKTL